MRKVVFTIIALLFTFTSLAIGLQTNQHTVIAEYFREMTEIIAF